MTDQQQHFTETQLRQALTCAAESVALPERLQRPSALLLAAGERQWARGRRAAGLALVGASLALVASVGLAVAGQGSLNWLPEGLAAEPQSPPASESSQVNPLRDRLILAHPVDQPVVTGRFGQQPNLPGATVLHRGIDFAVLVGDPVRAAADGTVSTAGWMDQYGNVVIISHGKVNGAELTTWYAHNSTVEVEVGQSVRRGDLIALAGSTGVATGPHLHFEVRVDGNPVDPMDWFGR